MKRHLTGEWLSNWTPTRYGEEVADRGCKGLLVRGGLSGGKTFYRFTQLRDQATGAVKRGRVKLGRWPALSLGDARDLVNEAREARHAEAAGTVDLTVGQLAEAYRRDVLSHREHADEAWDVVRIHVVEAKPDSRRPPFGEWSARLVRPADVAAVVRFAAAPREVQAITRTGQPTKRRLGGRGVARVVLRECKSIFAHAVETGSLEMTPAGTMRARAFGLRGASKRRPLDADEIKALFEALDLAALLDGTAKPQRLSAVVRLGLAFQLYVPLRSHSIIGAAWAEVDLEAGTWTVPVDRLKMRAEERTAAQPFTVTLPPAAVAILKRLQKEAGDSPWVLASPLDPKDHIESKALVRALARLQKAGRLALRSRFTVHDLRRTWRSLAGDLGVAFEVAEACLGHKLPGVAGVYARGQMVERRTEAAELVSAALDRIRLGKSAEVVPIAEAKG